MTNTKAIAAIDNPASLRLVVALAATSLVAFVYLMLTWMFWIDHGEDGRSFGFIFASILILGGMATLAGLRGILKIRRAVICFIGLAACSIVTTTIAAF